MSKALQISQDRSFFTKQLYLKQKLGSEVMTLPFAGDVAI